MIQIDEDEIIKVLSVERYQITTGLLEVLQDTQCDYIDDGSGHEDMYSITVEERVGGKMDEYEQMELSHILGLCDIYNCSYFRIIN